MNSRFLSLAVAALAAMPVFAAVQGSPQGMPGMNEPIKIETGLITGIPGWGWGVREYRGIPFAAPPVGNLRRRPPQPAASWQGAKSMQNFGAPCMQQEQPINGGSWNRATRPFSEDCLYLSAKKGVIVVSLNYRVNVFGWLAHPELTKESEHHASGNYGSLDQLAAIQWVQRNIAQFGGDPSNLNPNSAPWPNWTVYNTKNEYWLNIGDTIRMEKFNSARIDFIADLQESARKGGSR